MPGRRKRKAQPTNRTAELREQAKHVAGESGEALKAFAEATGSAAKEFGQITRKATKELVEAVEHAAAESEKEVKPKKRRRGRKVLGALVLGAIGVAVAGGGRIREMISGPPQEPWEPPAPGAATDGVTSTPTETETPPT